MESFDQFKRATKMTTKMEFILTMISFYLVNVLYVVDFLIILLKYDVLLLNINVL